MTKDIGAATLRQRTLRKKRFDAGFCASCGKQPPKPRKSTCTSCIAKATVRQRNLRSTRNETGLCATCGKNPKRPKKTNCTQCGAYFADQQRELREQRITDGLCSLCGKRPPRTTAAPIGRPAKKSLCCEPCMKKQRDAQQKRRKAGQTLPQQRRKAGLCIDCGSPDPIKVRCLVCLKKNRLTYVYSKYGKTGMQVMERDGCECQLCGATSHLHAHHIDGKGYDSREPNNALDNLVTLCNRCHYGITLLTTRGVDRARAIELLSK